ncbi:diguanylate cyclase [Solidesulfovibrio fructosivorans JJ]]|uniref:diguanylate cyclase n=1 Tax=Solidesulfovibrio fructosivorans JJ] TaxID=596151 RepID=E1K151_SOLFR|nr:GGDEF domain-containing protein [Solidesulfovibrio fructosivorans]EFL49678.1 diguanylate cyclase [Solidesulfovibrio fructosivorans JJ]]
MQNFDFKTASAIYVVSNFCIASLLAVAFADSRVRGTRLWIAGLFTLIFSTPFFALRDVIPPDVAIVLGNGLFALAWVLFQASFDAFYGNRRPPWQRGLPIFLAMVLAAGLLDAVKVRSLSLTTLYMLQSLAIAGTIVVRRREFRLRVIAILASGYVLAALSFMVRGLAVFFDPLANPDPFAPSMSQDIAMVLSVPSLIACSFGFVLLHRERVENEVRQLADIDPLTGLQNRRGFEAAFAKELREAADAGSWTSLALVDIDHFKTVNDRYGHALGDEALRTLARIVSRELRGGDLVARIGGDEFCVLLSRTPPLRAGVVAERLRRAVASNDWTSLGLTQRLTVTIGLSSHKGSEADDGEDFMRLADMALLTAKGMARDMVLHADQLTGRTAEARP